MNTTAQTVDRPPDSSGPRRRWSRRAVALAAVAALPLAGATAALATTAVVKANPGGLTAVGPVNSEYGFPAWYQDNTGKRVELCLDGNDPMCGFVAAPVAGFDNTQPTVFPTNFPDETFYASANSTLTLPNGGKATLGLSLEAAFTNQVQNGDQITFARQRIFVVGGPKNATLHFHEPYGNIDVDTDSTGKGRITEDIAPSVGNFDTPLKGNVGPFLTWDTGTVKTPSGEYLGDPAIPHAVTGGMNGNVFSVDYTDPTAPTPAQTATEPTFTVQGKVATNTGVKADSAVLGTDASGNKVVDVFASSEADPGELFVAADTAAGIKTTPMAASSTAAGDGLVPGGVERPDQRADLHGRPDDAGAGQLRAAWPPGHPDLRGHRDQPRLTADAVREWRSASGAGSAVAVEDRGLGQAGETLADAAGPCLPDALDGQEVLDGRGQQLLQPTEVVDQPIDDAGGQPRHPVQQPVPAGADGGVQRVGRGRQAVAAGDGGQVQELGCRQGPQVDEHLLDGARTAAAAGEVVADQQPAVLLDPGEHLVELQGQEPPVGAQLDDEALDLVGDAPDHLQPLADAHRVAHGDQVLDLQR